MKFFQCLLCCTLVFAGVVQVQAQLKKGQKFVKKGNYEQAVKAFEVDVFNGKGDVAVEAEYNLAKIYFTKEYENYDLEKAYQYAKSALKRHEKLTPDEMNRVQKKGLGTLMIENYKRQIVNVAYDSARLVDSYKAYEHFLRTFDGPTPIQFEKVTIWRNQRALEEAAKLNTWNAFENFYKKYHESCQQYSPAVDTQAQKYMMEAYMKERTWNNYYQFASQYPDNVYVRDSLAAENYLRIAQSNKMDDFKKYLGGFPKSPFVKLAMDNIFRLTIQSDLLDNYDYFVRTYPDYYMINAIWGRYFEVFTAQNGAKSGADFQKMYPNAPLKKINKINGAP